MGELPQGRARRTARFSGAVAGGAARAAGGAIVGRARRDPLRIERGHIEAAERLVETLGSMKGAAMKLGQLASFVELEFIPEEYREVYQRRLAELRAAAPAVDWRAIERVLHEEWGERPAAVLADVDPEPAAAASVGQVHRARLRDGREVAVKVQYPGVEEAIRADLQNAGLLVQLARAISPGLDARAVAAELRERVLEELDYELEAQAQRAFARGHRGHPFAHVPAVDTELSRRRVLVSEWVEGEGFDRWRGAPDAERDRLGEIVYRFYYGSLHRLGLINADPHPGNYLLLADGRVAFLDYGSTRRVPRERVELLSRTMLAASARDAGRLHRLVGELGYLAQPERLDAERLLANVRGTSGWFLVDREVRIDAALVRAALAAQSDPREALAVARATRLPAEDLQLQRLGLSVVAVLGQLRARRNWHRIALEMWDDAEPSTELGRAEAEWRAARGGR